MISRSRAQQAHARNVRGRTRAMRGVRLSKNCLVARLKVNTSPTSRAGTRSGCLPQWTNSAEALQFRWGLLFSSVFSSPSPFVQFAGPERDHPPPPSSGGHYFSSALESIHSRLLRSRLRRQIGKKRSRRMQSQGISRTSSEHTWLMPGVGHGKPTSLGSSDREARKRQACLPIGSVVVRRF